MHFSNEVCIIGLVSHDGLFGTQLSGPLSLTGIKATLACTHDLNHTCGVDLAWRDVLHVTLGREQIQSGCYLSEAFDEGLGAGDMVTSQTSLTISRPSARPAPPARRPCCSRRAASSPSAVWSRRRRRPSNASRRRRCCPSCRRRRAAPARSGCGSGPGGRCGRCCRRPWWDLTL